MMFVCALRQGSIHGVIGENGAGKSTLLKIAYGLLKPERGEVFVDGVKVIIDNPQHAIDNGIGMLPPDNELVRAALDY